MSQKNVERLEAMYEAFSRADFDAAVEIAHPEAEFIRPGLGTIRGPDAIRAWAEPEEAVVWVVWTFESEGLVSRAEVFLVEKEALAAAGLRE